MHSYQQCTPPPCDCRCHATTANTHVVTHKSHNHAHRSAARLCLMSHQLVPRPDLDPSRLASRAAGTTHPPAHRRHSKPWAGAHETAAPKLWCAWRSCAARCCQRCPRPQTGGTSPMHNDTSPCRSRTAATFTKSTSPSRRTARWHQEGLRASQAVPTRRACIDNVSTLAVGSVRGVSMR